MISFVGFFFSNVHSRWFRFQPKKAAVEVGPCGQSLGGHDPKARTDANNQHHQVPTDKNQKLTSSCTFSKHSSLVILDHKNCKFWFRVCRRRRITTSSSFGVSQTLRWTGEYEFDPLWVTALVFLPAQHPRIEESLGQHQINKMKFLFEILFLFSKKEREKKRNEPVRGGDKQSL